MSIPKRTLVAALFPALSVGAGLILFGSCTGASSQRYQRKLLVTGKPALHAVHNARLREIMRHFDELSLERLPQEMEPGLIRRPNGAEVARVANAMSAAAMEIPAATADLDLNDEDRRLFRSLARKLQSEAAALAKLAESEDSNRIGALLDEIFVTCNACHTAFRIMPHTLNNS